MCCYYDPKYKREIHSNHRKKPSKLHFTNAKHVSVKWLAEKVRISINPAFESEKFQSIPHEQYVLYKVDVFDSMKNIDHRALALFNLVRFPSL